MTCSHFRKNRPKKRQKPAGCRSRIISKNRPVPIFGRSTGASLQKMYTFPTVPYWKRRRERALPAWCTLRQFVRASAYYIERKLWKRRLWNMISFALLAITLFRFFGGGMSIWCYCRLSLNVSRISKTKPTKPHSLCSVCLTRPPRRRSFGILNLTQAVRTDLYAKMEMLVWICDIYI